MYEKYYHILGLTNNASRDEIKRAYRRLAMQYHPDLNPGKQAKELFFAIQEAYDVLYNGTTPKSIYNNPQPTAKQQSTEEILQEIEAENWRKKYRKNVTAQDKSKWAKERGKYFKERVEFAEKLELSVFEWVSNSWYYKIITGLAAIGCLIGILIFVDLLTPALEQELPVSDKYAISDNNLPVEERGYYLIICDRAIKVNGYIYGFQLVEPTEVVVSTSRIFKDVKSVYGCSETSESTFEQTEKTIYSIFPLFPVLILLPFWVLIKKPNSPWFYICLVFTQIGTLSMLIHFLFVEDRFWRIFAGFGCG